MLNDVQEKILINERKKLLEQIKTRDEIIDFLLDALEAERIDSRGFYSEKIFARWNLEY